MSESFDRRHSPKSRSNIVVPSRSAADPGHDLALSNTVLFLGQQGQHGIGGQAIEVELPPPPRITDSLLPEVRAALDTNVRQDDLEASHFYDEDDSENEAGDGAGEELADNSEVLKHGTALGTGYPDERLEFEEFMDEWEQSFLFDASRDQPR